MRAFIAFCGLASALMTNGQSTAAYERVEVVKVDSTITAAQLHANARRWFVDAFKDAKEVVQFDDPATNTIVGKGSFKYETTIFLANVGRQGHMRFTLEVACKNGRYRVKFSDFTHEALNGLGLIRADNDLCGDGPSYRNLNGDPTKFLTRVCNEEVWPQIHETEERLLASLRAAMTKTTTTTGDW